VVAGPIVGLVGGAIVTFVGERFFRAADGTTSHRNSQILAMAVVLLSGVGLLIWFAPYFDDLPSKYVSKGEYLRQYLSVVVWPVILLVVYLGIAGQPSLRHPVLGEGTKPRHMAVRFLIAVALFSSLYIGAYWMADNFPHPD
jgi:hypothetical protein